MSLDTMVYSNHVLKIPENANEIVSLLVDAWGGKIEIVDSINLKEENLISNPSRYKIFVTLKGIEFEYTRFNQITLYTNFKFAHFIKLCSKTIRFQPAGIGRNAANMIANFMDEPLDFLIDEENLKTHLKSWNSFKSFVNDCSSQIGGTKHIYFNDGILFSGIEEIAFEGGTIEEMITQSKKIIEPCKSKKHFLDNHTQIRADGIRNVRGDIWFYEGKK
jgi:hypothetical protein